MTFDATKEYNSSRLELLEIITSDHYFEALKDWVIRKSNSGFSKRQIYDTLLLFHKDIGDCSTLSDKPYNRLSDFLDGFTSFAVSESVRILPNEPDV
jgi:hypothetical protein